MSAFGYKQTSSRPKSKSALPPAPDIPAQMYGSGPIRSGLWPCSVHPHWRRATSRRASGQGRPPRQPILEPPSGRTPEPQNAARRGSKALGDPAGMS